MSRYGYLKVFQRVPRTEIMRVDCISIQTQTVYTVQYSKCLLYPRHKKCVKGYIVITFPFVCLFVHLYTYICSSFHHILDTRVKAFVLKFIRPYIIKTLCWISFILGMMVDISLKFYSVPSTPGPDLEVKVMDLEFLYKSHNFLHLSLYYVMNFMHIWHDGRYWSRVSLSMIPIPGCDLDKVGRSKPGAVLTG